MSFWDDPWESAKGTVEDVTDVVKKVTSATDFGSNDALGDAIGINPLDLAASSSYDPIGIGGQYQYGGSEGYAEELGQQYDNLTGKTLKDAEDEAAERIRVAALKGEELEKHRFAQTEERLSPWMSSEKEALAAYRGEMGLGPKVGTGSPYMDSPAYQAMLDESLGAVEQTAASSGSTAYGGRRLKEAGKVGAGVQQSFYNNYMNMLSEASQPNATTNVSSLGLGQAATMGAAGRQQAQFESQQQIQQAQSQQQNTQGLVGLGLTALEYFI